MTATWDGIRAAWRRCWRTSRRSGRASRCSTSVAGLERSPHLAAIVGAGRVGAAEPSPGFARACVERVPGADVRIAPSETLPWANDTFDVVVSQLVLSFVKDADAAVGEMRRVDVPGGTIAACTWDYAGQMQMLTTFWKAAAVIDPDAPAEGRTTSTTTGSRS